MVVVNTNTGPRSLNTPEEVAAALDAGIITVGQAGAAQVAIGQAGGGALDTQGGGGGGGTPAPAAQGGGPDISARPIAQILADFKAGRITEGVAFDEMFVALQALGQTDVVARDNVRDIIRVANEDLTQIANRPGGVVSAFGETAADRETAFQGELGRRFAGGVGRRTAGALGRQFDAISPAFQFGRGLGNLDPGLDFRNFLGTNLGGGGGGLDLGGLVNQAAGLFGADLSGADQNIQRSFRQNLLDNPNQGFNLALQSGLQNIPLFLQGSFRSLANRALGRFRTDTPINPVTGQPDLENNPFLPAFVERGGFGGL